jgi:hypothetical protein
MFAPVMPLPLGTQARAAVAALSAQRREADVSSSVEYARTVWHHTAQSSLRSFAVVLANGVRIWQQRRKAIAFSKLRRHAYEQGVQVGGVCEREVESGRGRERLCMCWLLGCSAGLAGDRCGWSAPGPCMGNGGVKGAPLRIWRCLVVA